MDKETFFEWMNEFYHIRDKKTKRELFPLYVISGVFIFLYLLSLFL